MGDHAAAVTATQVRRPWRTTVRSTVWAIVGFAPLVPAIVQASGADETIPAVAGGIALSSAVTRIAALPGLEAWLRRHARWLAADPAPKP